MVKLTRTSPSGIVHGNWHFITGNLGWRMGDLSSTKT